MSHFLSSKNNLLIVGNFASDTGYAWETIQEYFIALGQMFFKRGDHAVVCFPEVKDIPAKFKSTNIMVVQFDFSKSSLPTLYRFLRKRQIGILYLTDWPTYSIRYFCCRLAGVRTIIVHKRTAGGKNLPGRLMRWVKRTINRNPLCSADHVIVISEYVRHRVSTVFCFPEDRITRIWNGVDIDRFKPGFDETVFQEFMIPKDKNIIFSYSRAVRDKGVQVLIEAADLLINVQKRTDLFFLYCGDGPHLETFRRQIKQSHLEDHFLCPGKTNAISRLLKGVCIVVVPSVWQEPFGLSVIEAMATGKAVIASRVGGIVDIIKDSTNGYLFTPGDSKTLAARILSVIDDDHVREDIEHKARQTVVESFNIKDKKLELLAVFDRIVLHNHASEMQ